MVSNPHGQEIGAPIAGWTSRPLPGRMLLQGQFCRLEPLAPRHADALFAAYAEAPDGRDWTYLPTERIDDATAYRAEVVVRAASVDPLHYAIVDPSGRPIGTSALMRIDPANGVIEIGHIAYAPALQRTPAGTEAIVLLMRYVFEDLGYRRLEWKCDALNEPSRRAALRYGFVFEGIFRQAIVTKGRNRDTAWFSIIDGDWPRVRCLVDRWLRAENFDLDGRQIVALSSLQQDR